MTPILAVNSTSIETQLVSVSSSIFFAPAISTSLPTSQKDSSTERRHFTASWTMSDRPNGVHLMETDSGILDLSPDGHQGMAQQFVQGQMVGAVWLMEVWCMFMIG